MIAEPVVALAALDDLLDAASAQVVSARSNVRVASAALAAIQSNPEEVLAHLQVESDDPTYRDAADDSSDLTAAIALVAIHAEVAAELAAERWEAVLAAISSADLDDMADRLHGVDDDSDSYWAPLELVAATDRLVDTAQAVVESITEPADVDASYSKLFGVVGHAYQVAVASALAAANAYEVAAVDACALAGALADVAKGGR